ncbi:MAG: hypothetical protein Alpg2KO_15720 [Alphaproteobacteria bacterium]
MIGHDNRGHEFRGRADKRGASLLSYGLVVGLIAVVALGAVTSVGSNTNSLFTDVSGTLDNVITGQGGGGSTGPAASPDASASPSPAPSPSPALAASCQAILTANPAATDGVYQIDPDGDTNGTDVWCDMTTSGGGWTRIFYSHRTPSNSYTNWTAGDFTFLSHGTVDSGSSWSVVLPDLAMGTIMMGCANGNTSSIANTLTDPGNATLVGYLRGQSGRTGIPDTFTNSFDTNLGVRADYSENWAIWYLQDNSTSDLAFGENGETYGYEVTAYNVAQCRGTSISSSNALIVQVR